MGDEISPKVIDFGLAKAFDDANSANTKLTRHFQVIGTPLYMSPEQADPRRVDVDTRADVYSLGVLLHVLLSGLTPAVRNSSNGSHRYLEKHSYLETLSTSSSTEIPPSRLLRSEPLWRQEKIATGRASDPRDLLNSLSGDLDWIVMKCLEPDRERRYESVASIAKDISRYLNSEPIEARPPSKLYQINRFVKRNRSTVAVITTLFVAMLIVAVVSVWQGKVARNAELRSEQALQDAFESQQKSEALLYAADLRLADQALRDGDAGEAIRLIDRHKPTTSSGGWDHRGIEWQLLRRRATSTRKTIATGSKALVELVRSPDNKRLAIVSDDGDVILYDPSRDEQVGGFKTEFGIATSAAWAPDSSTLAVGSADGEIELWDTSTTKLNRTIRFGAERIWDLHYSRDGTRLIVSGATPEVRIFEATTGEQIDTLRGHEDSVESLALSADGQFLACASNDRNSTVWEWQTSKIITRSPRAGQRLTCVAITPDGRLMVDGAVKGEVRVISVESGKVLRRAQFAAAVQALDVSPDGGHVAIGTRDGIIHLLPLRSVTASKAILGPGDLDSFAAHDRRITAIAWVDRERVASVSRDATCMMSSIDTNDSFSVTGSLKSSRIAISRDGRWIAAHDYQRVQLIDTQEQKVRDLRAFTTDAKFAGIAFTPAADELLVATSDCKLLIAPMENLDAVHEGSLEVTADFSDLRFSQNGRRLMLHSRSDRILAVVEYPSLSVIFQKPCPRSFTAAISPDGRLLAMSDQGDVFVYDVVLGERIAESMTHHAETINDLRFNSEGSPLLFGAHPGGVPTALAVSADGRTLLTSSRSGEVWAWSVPARQKLFPVCRAESGYRETLLSADDSTLAVVDQTGSIAWYAVTNDNAAPPK
jgi:WD40 repeat protein